MITIELPCCGAATDLEDDARTVRCEVCGIEHLLAPDARPADRLDPPSTVTAVAAPEPLVPSSTVTVVLMVPVAGQ